MWHLFDELVVLSSAPAADLEVVVALPFVDYFSRLSLQLIKST